MIVLKTVKNRGEQSLERETTSSGAIGELLGRDELKRRLEKRRPQDSQLRSAIDLREGWNASNLRLSNEIISLVQK
jgi:hypothetical protein